MLNSYVALDIETTGLNPAKDSIIEVGAIRIENGTVTDMLSTLVNPGYHIPDRITDITGIDDDMVKDAPAIDSLIERIVGITEGDYHYHCKIDGEFVWFQGYEEIFYIDEKIYECHFHGRAIR